MTQSERERLHQRIDNSHFKAETEKELHTLVDEFLSPGYIEMLGKGISSTRANALVVDFGMKKGLIHANCRMHKDSCKETYHILADLERIYFTILDQSVNAKKGLLERCIAALKVPLHLSPKIEGNLLSPKTDLSISKNEAELPRDSDAKRMESEN